MRVIEKNNLCDKLRRMQAIIYVNNNTKIRAQLSAESAAISGRRARSVILRAIDFVLSLLR